MLFPSSVIALLVVGAVPSLATPAQVVRGLRARVPTAEEAKLNARSLYPLVGRKDKKDGAIATTTITSTASASAATTGAATSGTVVSVLQVGEEGSQKIRTSGVFGSPNSVQGGFVFTKLIMPSNTAGSIEPEYNSSVANTITVVPKSATLAPPAGMMYVDPLTFVISTATPPIAGDTMKVDYIFTQALTLAMNTTKGTIGKLDTATNQFVTEGLGEFEFEQDENEWSLTVADMNGEWAVFVPTTAVLPAKAED